MHSAQAKWMAFRLLSGLILLAATGCIGDDRPAAHGVQVVTAPELSRYRDAAAGKQAPIDWVEPSMAGQGSTPEAHSAAEQAIRAAAKQLADVNYATLSLPDFVTYTRALAPAPTDFTGKGVEVDAYGTSRDSKHRWILYRWRGPELPAHPERPLVRRWIYVYALYDLEGAAVTRLLATVQGEVQE